jgi:hypothetical protein
LTPRKAVACTDSNMWQGAVPTHAEPCFLGIVASPPSALAPACTNHAHIVLPHALCHLQVIPTHHTTTDSQCKCIVCLPPLVPRSVFWLYLRSQPASSMFFCILCVPIFHGLLISFKCQYGLSSTCALTNVAYWQRHSPAEPPDIRLHMKSGLNSARRSGICSVQHQCFVLLYKLRQ